MAKSLEERYEEAAAKVRGNSNKTNKNAYHALRDELVERTRVKREERGAAGAVIADNVKVD